MQFFDAEGVTIHYRVEGKEAGTPLAFINSLGTDLRIWDGVVTHFTGRFRVIRHDKRGHGLSDCPPGPYTIHDHAQDVAALLDHLNVNEAILVGISVGGLIALDYTLHHPERVRALVLCDTGAKIGTAEMWNERIDTLRQHGMAYLAEAITGRWFTSGFKQQHPAAYRGYYNMLARMPVEGYTATCAALRDADLRGAIGAITTKSLVICGTEDVATPPALARELADGLPNAQLVMLENAAHLPCIEHPDGMAAVIGRFLEENGYAR